MKLDVTVSTFNRVKSLERALLSLSEAKAPAGLDVTVTVIDNNSSDGTAAAVEALREKFHYPLNYIFEGRQGQVYARNTGIAQTSGDLIAFVDDDEEIGPDWYREVSAAFSDPSIDFIGGPYVARWAIAPPAWMTPRVAGPMGGFNLGDQSFEWRRDSPGAIPGGNAVIRRTAIQKVGPFSTSLGVFGKRHVGNDDTEMHLRLVDAGAKGLYIPKLFVYHHIPEGRLTKKYARNLKFWGGVSNAKIDQMRPEPVPRVLGIPRYLYRRTLREFGCLLRTLGTHHAFQHELELVYFAGFVYGYLG